MMIRAFDVERVEDKEVISLGGVALMSFDAAHADTDPGIRHRLVDKLHNEIHPILKQIGEEPGRLGELLAEFNGVRS